MRRTRLGLLLALGVATAAVLVESGRGRPSSAPSASPASVPPIPRHATEPVLAEPSPGAMLPPSDDASLPLSTGDAREALRALVAQRPQAAFEDPALLIDEILDQMDDAQLRAALSQLTGLQASDLEGIRDLRGYSRRLAGIAVRGVVAPAPPEGRAVPEVVFSRSVDEMGAPADTTGRFDGAARERIYALFPTESYTSNKVLAKWYRDEPASILDELKGPPRLLLFGRYPVHPGDPTSHVWLSRKNDWEPGKYVVEFYDPAEPLAKLAEGRFTVAAESGPAK